MIRRYVTVTCAALMAATSVAATAPPIDPGACRPSGALMRLAGLPEASGLTASRATPDRLWAHNDSGNKAEIIAFDTTGKVAGHVAITGTQVVDWEAIAAAPCGNRSCLYVGDIGDNDAKRKDIVIYRIVEPESTTGTVEADAVIRASYPDGPHNAEALLAAADGTLYVVTKGNTGQVALYRLPADAGGSATRRLERVGQPLSKGPLASAERITDGAISLDGEWVVLRTLGTLTFYRAADFLKGNFSPVQRVDLKSLQEPQGEGVAFGSANTVYVAGEGGSKSQPGTLAVLSCGN